MGYPFQRVLVDHAAQAGVRVTWQLASDFCPAGPWSFQLETGHTGNPAADDWASAGVSLINPAYLLDVARREEGRSFDVYYRVRLTVTGTGQHYVSDPEPSFGALPARQWLLVREIVRKEALRMRMDGAATGWLLKRRRHGGQPSPSDPRTAGVGFLSGEVNNSRLASTYGTEFLDGYYLPMPFTIDFNGLGGVDERRDGVQARNTTDEPGRVHRGRAVVVPLVQSQDVFIAAGSNERFYVQQVEYQLRVGRLPVIGQLTCWLAPVSDVIYQFPAPAIDPYPKATYCG